MSMSDFTCPRCSAGLPCRGVDTPRLHELAARDQAWLARLDPECLNETPAKTPGLLSQVASALGAGGRFLAAGLPMVPGDVFADRMATCQACGHYDAPENRCNSCGCFLKVKALLGSERCPIGKWLEYAPGAPCSSCGGR